MSEKLGEGVIDNDQKETYSGPDWSILSDLSKKNPDASPAIQTYGRFSPENSKRYIEDRFFENLSMLKYEVKDQSFVKLYQNITEEYPSLRIVKIIDDPKQYDNAYFDYANIQSSGSYAPEVVCNFSRPESYAFSESHNLEKTMNDRLGTGYFIKRLAFAIGADWRQCAKNVRLNADATLLHELGHAHDFIENYIRPEYKKDNGDCRCAKTLYRATKIATSNRSEFRKQGPNPNGEWVDRGSEDWRKLEHRLKAMGIDNYDEYMHAVHQYYRDMPDEAYADKFAYDYIINHYDDYFTTDKNEHSERILVDKIKEIKLDPDFVHILGIKQGLGVEIDRLDNERKSIKHTSGFLAMNMYVGKSVYLYENGDPKNPGEKWRICKGISEMTLKPVRNEETGKINHYVFFKDEDGVEYHISRTKEEPKSVLCSPDEMAKELGLQVGDKVQLIEHLGDDARAIDFDKIRRTNTQIIEGEVLRIDGDHKGENVVINYQIGNTATGLNYPPIRKWKRWYVGDYEILPLPEDMK